MIFPKNIRFISTPMQIDGGFSKGLYSNFNLATHTGDVIDDVYKNRELLKKAYNLPSEVKWLNQIHSDICLVADDIDGLEDGDSSITKTTNTICAILTADCLPIFASDNEGKIVGICHAGWQGILAGVIEAFVLKMNVKPQDMIILFGTAIGENALELGEDIYLKFLSKDKNFIEAFTQKDDKYFLNIYKIATIILNQLIIENIHQNQNCTYNGNYFSYRRDGAYTGRNAHLIWIE